VANPEQGCIKRMRRNPASCRCCSCSEERNAFAVGDEALRGAKHVCKLSKEIAEVLSVLNSVNAVVRSVDSQAFVGRQWTCPTGVQAYDSRRAVTNVLTAT